MVGVGNNALQMPLCKESRIVGSESGEFVFVRKLAVQPAGAAVGGYLFVFRFAPVVRKCSSRTY